MRPPRILHRQRLRVRWEATGQPSLWEMIKEWFHEMMEHIFGRGYGAKAWDVLTYILIAAAIALVNIILFRSNLRVSSSRQIPRRDYLRRIRREYSRAEFSGSHCCCRGRAPTTAAPCDCSIFGSSNALPTLRVLPGKSIKRIEIMRMKFRDAALGVTSGG